MHELGDSRAEYQSVRARRKRGRKPAPGPPNPVRRLVHRVRRWNVPLAADMLRIDIPEQVLSSLRRTYPRGYADLEWIAETPGEITRQNGVDTEVHEYLPRHQGTRIVGFFPGLGSRAGYQNLGRALLDSGIPEVVEIYRDGARALGCPDQLEKLLLLPGNLPEGKLERQGFIGAAFLVHNLALAAYLRAAAENGGVHLRFMAYTGESFGVIASAVASGSLSVGDGVRIARAFTPLCLVAAEGDSLGDPFAEEMATYLPGSVRGRPLVPEPFHVVALKGDPEALAEALEQVGKLFPKADVEVHKTYSCCQTNVYVRAGAKPDFDQLMTRFPDVTVAELKAPTTFLAHSERMRDVRRGLARFMDENGILFQAPRVPVISNNDAGLLTTAAAVRDGILAMTDEVMASRSTVETIGALHPDMVLELGLGNKSVRLLADNDIEAPALGYTGAAEETDLLLRAVKLVEALLKELARLYAGADPLAPKHYDLLRDLVRQAVRSPFCEKYLYRTMVPVITSEMLHSDRRGSAAFYQFIEAFQHTYHHRDSVDVDNGELVLRARLKKRMVGRLDGVGQAYVELKVIDGAGDRADRCSIGVRQPEAVVFHFDGLAELDDADVVRKLRLLLDTQPSARQICERTNLGHILHQPGLCRLVYQYLLFQLLRLHRPAIFAQSDCYLEGSDPLGWLVALEASGAVPLADVVELYPGAAAGTDGAALNRMLSTLRTSEVPVVSPDGVPLHARKDLEAATRAVFRGGGVEAPVRRVHLNGSCHILSLGSAVDPAQVDAGPFWTEVISVPSPSGLWRKGVNPALDAFEVRAMLALTGEHERVLRFAQSRRLLSSTVYAYTNIRERVVGFGKGGSESMTIFVSRDGASRIAVRKILSEALTTAHWNRAGEGVMLPPFAKAKKQAEYLQALPESVGRYFPEVHDVLERNVPVPLHLRHNGMATHREVIYEMDYVPGVEVSRFIEAQSPPPLVVACLYEQVLRALHEEVHTVSRVPAPGQTLDISYFKKIEDRLALCRETAPDTFSPQLLDTERIVINGISYLNHSALLERFRGRPEFRGILEPRFHSLVMGDTNTENVKVVNPEPLLHAQRLIEAEAPPEEIDAALAVITPESLGIKFLDPRAIGFNGTGGETNDDPMYDNKPWHNSIGHYDEIHFEHFSLQVRTGAGQTPRVDIQFNEGNPYQRAYRVRDVAVDGGSVDKTAPQGIEDYFDPVMTAVYDLDDPDSAYLRDDPYWLIRFVFIMGTHFTAMPPFHFQAELDGTLVDTYQTQRRPVAIYCEGIKWLNWALEMLDGRRTEFLGVQVPTLPERGTLREAA
jgi:malonyl CoA-acyl carrier protein transacylase